MGNKYKKKFELYNPGDEKVRYDAPWGPYKELHPEPYRTRFRRDYARLIHCAGFRRLQGKTQLFPGIESDFFRNRLTHSIEVAQIAKSIAIRLSHKYKRKIKPINTVLAEFAALAHDLGHPPFGHVGERALDHCMLQHGGYEGNAQTLRILAKIEKSYKDTDERCGISKKGKDKRYGLNLSYRALASILKYDNQIPKKRSKDGIEKGYYYTEESLVKEIKKAVVPNLKRNHSNFMTIECSIMDVADDIAYSTFDLEDILKAGFLTPLSILSKKEYYPEVARRVSDALASSFSEDNVKSVLFDLFLEPLTAEFKQVPKPVGDNQQGSNANSVGQEDIKQFSVATASIIDSASNRYSQDPYHRSALISHLIGRYVRGVELDLNESYPQLSRAYLNEAYRREVEVLKQFTFVSQITSPRLKVLAYRGRDIVEKIFNTLWQEQALLPKTYQEMIQRFSDESLQKRVICDYISGMTDRYALEFYARITSERAESIFKPLD